MLTAITNFFITKLDVMILPVSFGEVISRINRAVQNEGGIIPMCDCTMETLDVIERLEHWGWITCETVCMETDFRFTISDQGQAVVRAWDKITGEER